MSACTTIKSAEDRRKLLRLARQTAERELVHKGVAPLEKPVIEGRAGGAFVTFWRGKGLRGCIGTFIPTHDIAATIEEVTRSSLKDPRFTTNPITAAELPELTIEISILSDPEPTDDPLSLVPGKHGIIVRCGMQSGCFLPKVAAERDWSAEEFLSNCCATKAGLPPDAWRDPGAQVLLFEADVFDESEFT